MPSLILFSLKNNKNNNDKKEIRMSSDTFYCLFDFRFYSPVDTVKVMLNWLVYFCLAF